MWLMLKDCNAYCINVQLSPKIPYPISHFSMSPIYSWISYHNIGLSSVRTIWPALIAVFHITVGLVFVHAHQFHILFRLLYVGTALIIASLDVLMSFTTGLRLSSVSGINTCEPEKLLNLDVSGPSFEGTIFSCT